MRRKNEANLLVKECIVTALIDLMKTTDYAAITITDIAKRAGVSRMAYYRNYISKDDILNKYMEEVGEKIHQVLSKSVAKGDIRQYYRILFEELGHHSELGIVVYRAHMGELIYNNVKKYMKMTFGDSNNSVAGDYLISSYAGSFHAVFMKWICSGKQETSDEIAEIFCQTIRM